MRKYGQDAHERLRPRPDGLTGEERFTELVQQYIGPTDTVVDIGTGDAGWLMSSVTPRVRRAVGFDYAARRLWLGAQQRAAMGAKNAELFLAYGRHIPLLDRSADAVINRRGPWTHDETFMREGVRVLALGGLAFEIAIGEQNARELDGLFGVRSQMHGPYTSGQARVSALTALYERAGLQVLVAESYVCSEVFASREALFFRLETAPTVEGFDPKADAALIDEFIAERGLSLTLHRAVLAGRRRR